MSEKSESFSQKSKRVAKGYISRRFGNKFINEVGRDTFKSSVLTAKNTIAPKKIDPEEAKTGYYGRYKDGGKEKFHRMVSAEHLTEDDLNALSRDLKKQSKLVSLGGFLFLTIGLYISFTGDSWSSLRNGIGTSFAALIFVAMAFRQDFCRWQVDQRRFGALREYLFQKD